MVKSKEQESSKIDLSDKDWASLSSPMKSFLEQQGITKDNFQKSQGAPKRRFRLGERRHRPVAEQPTETDEEGNPAIDSGATTRELSYHQANMEQQNPAIVVEQEESPEDVESRRQSEFADRFVGRNINPATGRKFTKEEILLIYQKYQEINPDINDVLDMDPNEVHEEVRNEIESLISSESDPDRKEFLEGTLDAFTDGDRPSYVFEGDELHDLFVTLCENLGTYSEEIDDPNRKERLKSIIELSANFSIGKTDVLGDVEEVIEKELENETNADRKKQLKELLEGLNDGVAIHSAERFARSQASRVARGHEAEFVNWVTKLVTAQGSRGTKEMRENHRIGGMAVAYDTYGILHYLCGETPESSNSAESDSGTTVEADKKSLLEASTPDFAAIYKRMSESKTRAIDWSKVEAFSPYGREFHNYFIAQEAIRGIEGVDESDRLIHESIRKRCLEWRAVLRREKEPTKEQLDRYHDFVRKMMGQAFSKELERDYQTLIKARNLADFDRFYNEGSTIKRIKDAHGENLSPEDQAYYERMRDEYARARLVEKLCDQVIQQKNSEIEQAKNPSDGYVEMGEDEGHPERFIARRKKEIDALAARRKEILNGAELTPEEETERKKYAGEFTFEKFVPRADARKQSLRKKLTEPPLAGLRGRVERAKSKLPEGQTLDDLVARCESQHRYYLELTERYQSGKGNTDEETAEIRAYRDKVASPLKYFEYLRGMMADKKKSHEINLASKQRITDIIERDQGSFSTAVLGEYPDRVATGWFDDEAKKSAQLYDDSEEGIASAVERYKELFPEMTEEAIRQKVITEVADNRDELKKRIEKKAGDGEAYLFERYGHNIAILGVDIEDHPGKLETLQRMADDLSEHVEHLRRRIEHVPNDSDYDHGVNDMFQIISERVSAETALQYLEGIIELVKRDAAEAKDTSRLQVASSTERSAEAAA